MSVTLHNVAMPPEQILIHLVHDKYCSHVGKCSCSRVEMQEVVSDKLGKKSMRIYKKKIPKTLRVPAKGVEKDLHDCVRNLPDVISAVRVGKLKVELVQDKRTGGQQPAAAEKPAKQPRTPPKRPPKKPKTAAKRTTRTCTGGNK